MIFLMLKTTVKMKVIICIHMNLGARKYAFRRAPSEDSRSVSAFAQSDLSLSCAV